MADDGLVLFIEGVQRSPGEGDPVPQNARVARQVRVLPCGPLRLLVTDAKAEPPRRPELAMSRRARLRHEHALAHVTQREERDRVAVRLMEQDDVLAVDHPLFAEPPAHPAAERLREEQALRPRLRDGEPAHRPGPTAPPPPSP